MRRDYADWKIALGKLIALVEAGTWRHGIKTNDAVKKFCVLGRLPLKHEHLWATIYRKRCGDIADFLLYYWVQAGLKNRRWTFVGASGKKYRLRRIHNVEHGNGNGEIGADGEAPTAEKEGLWMREEDMHQPDVRLVRGMYRARRGDAGADIKFLDAADVALMGKPAAAVVGDVLDEIAAAM